MLRVFVYVIALLVLAQPAAAQSSVYAGASGAMTLLDASSPTLDALDPFAAVGGFVGLRLHDAWSIEIHLDQGFGETPERERLDGFGRAFVQDRAGKGFAVLGVWKRHRPLSRIGFGVTFGIAGRVLETHTVRAIRRPSIPTIAAFGSTSRDWRARRTERSPSRRRSWPTTSYRRWECGYRPVASSRRATMPARRS